MSTTAQQTAIDVRPVAGYIGAEIHGVDLASDLDDAIIAEIRTALLRWKVVFFRDQRIGHAEQIAFGRRFGKVTPAHVYDHDSPEGFPEINPETRSRFEKQIGWKRHSRTVGWHTDITAVVNPPAASILRAVNVPPYGGDTQWTNLVAAYEDLPESLQRFADGLRARHSFKGDFVYGDKNSVYAQQVLANPQAAIHPLVRVHPETGERVLFVSPGFTARESQIIGFDKEQSQQVLKLFWEQATRPEYTVRFRWEPGSVAFWDNRSTAHVGPRDLGHLDFDRELYRITLEGDVPVGPDGQKSELVEGQPFLGN